MSVISMKQYLKPVSTLDIRPDVGTLRWLLIFSRKETGSIS